MPTTWGSGRNIGTADSVWDSPIDFGANSNTYKLLRALLSEADRIDTDLEEIYDQQHINSSTGEELDQFGELVKVDRKTGESDEKYRARIKASFRASTMGTTYDQFTEFCSVILDTDISNLTFNTNLDALPATITVSASPSIYSDSNITAQELNNLLGRGVPAGHSVQVIEKGSFRLKSDGQTDDPSKGLTSDNISTGGTLATDVV